MPDQEPPTRYEAMAAELMDLRAKITPRTAQVLAALNMATGVERSQLARDVLDRWAADQIHSAIMIGRLTRSEGVDGAAEGAGSPS